MKLPVQVLLLGSILVLSACSSQRADQHELQPGIPAASVDAGLATELSDGTAPLRLALPELVDLPALERIANATTADYFKKGSQLAQPGFKENAIVLGDSLIMGPDWDPKAQPPASELSWGIYGYHLPGYDRAARLDLSWAIRPDSSQYYVAVSDFGNSRWRWFQAGADDSFDFGSLAGHFSNLDTIYFAVLLTGTGSFELTQLRLGGNFLPEASFTVDQNTGEYSLTTGFDASASSDPDGSIVSYQWAFEDPVYFEPGELGPTPTHKYDHVSGYTCTLRVVDNEGGTAEATAGISVTGLAGNMKPTAVLDASSSGGVLPLGIIFDAFNSLDPDDVITGYRWDMDGDGYHEIASGFPQQYREFITAGVTEVGLMVIDAFGAFDTDSKTITITGVSGTNPPTARLDLDYYCLQINQQRTIDASLSSDPDNDIVKYEWDFEGDGTFDYDNGLYSLGEVVYTLPGEFDPVLRITDSGGRQDTATLHVVVSDLIGLQESEPNDLSTVADSLGGFMNYAKYVKDWQGGLSLADTVDWYVFDADRAEEISIWADYNAAALEMELALYAEADLDLPLAVSSDMYNTQRQLLHLALPAAGRYYLKVYIPPAALKQGPGTYTMCCLENHSPVAMLSSNVNFGFVPFEVPLDASGSSDLDEALYIFDYDLDDDGFFEVVDTYNPLHVFTISDPGSHYVWVRVTDSLGERAYAFLAITAF